MRILHIAGATEFLCGIAPGDLPGGHAFVSVEAVAAAQRRGAKLDAALCVGCLRAMPVPDWIDVLDATLEDRATHDVAIEVRRLIAAYRTQQAILVQIEADLGQVVNALGQALVRIDLLNRTLTP